MRNVEKDLDDFDKEVKELYEKNEELRKQSEDL